MELVHYFGSDQSARQVVEVAQAFGQTHELGMAAALCYLCHSAFKQDKDYPLANARLVARMQPQPPRPDLSGNLRSCA